jgi:uncharacterized membrane protein
MATADPGRATRSGGQRTGWGWWAAWGVLVLSCLGVSLFSFPPYLPLVPDAGRLPVDPGFPLTHEFVIALHAVPGGLAMLLGPPQFVDALRRRYPAAHRWTGRAYLVCVGVGGVVSLLASIVAATGAVAQTGFFLLALLWLYSGMKAYTSIRNGDIQLHRIWMIRNFALTFAAVMLRVFLGLGTAVASLPFEEAYAISAWASFAVSLVFAEWFIVQRYMRPTARRGNV